MLEVRSAIFAASGTILLTLYFLGGPENYRILGFAEFSCLVEWVQIQYRYCHPEDRNGRIRPTPLKLPTLTVRIPENEDIGLGRSTLNFPT